jgi:hypothetical protein
MDATVGKTPELETLSLDEVQKLDDGNRADYLAFRRMFESTGWKLYLDWLRMQTNQATVAQLAATTWERVNQHKGQAAAFIAAANLEGLVEHTYKGMVVTTDETTDSLQA